MYNTSINPNLKYQNKLGGKHQTMVNFEIGPKVNFLWKQVQPVDFFGAKKGGSGGKGSIADNGTVHETNVIQSGSGKPFQGQQTFFG